MRTLTDTVIGVLEAELTVGDGTGEGLTTPYVVVYPGTQSRDGTLDDGWSDVAKTFLAICEGTSREQAEWMADKVESLLTGSALVVVAVNRADVNRDDTTGDPSRWKAPVRVRVRDYA